MLETINKDEINEYKMHRITLNKHFYSYTHLQNNSLPRNQVDRPFSNSNDEINISSLHTHSLDFIFVLNNIGN